MPPHLPVIGISRSQSLRIGRGPGNVMAPQFNGGDLPINPDTGALYTVLYADLGNAQARRDIQHHSAEGAIETVGGAASNTIWSDLYCSNAGTTALVASNGSGYSINVTGGAITSRFYGPAATLQVPAATVTPAAASAYDRWDQVYVTPAGVVGITQGAPGTAATTYNVFSMTSTASGGTFTMAFNYNGYPYTTGAISGVATVAAVQTALRTPTSNPMPLPGQATVGATTALLTTSGGTLGSAPVVVTASGGLEGPITNLTLLDGSALTGGTVTFATTAVGNGTTAPVPNGNNLPIANVLIPANATTNAGFVYSNFVLRA